MLNVVLSVIYVTGFALSVYNFLHCENCMLWLSGWF